MGFEAPALASDLPGGASQVVKAFRDAIAEDAKAEQTALETLRAALGLPRGAGEDASNTRITGEQNLQLENGLRLLLQECVEAASEAGVPVLQYGLSEGRTENEVCSDREQGGKSDEGQEGSMVLQEADQSKEAEVPRSPRGLVTRLLDIVLWLCEAGQVEGGMVLQLLEDLLECSVISDCKAVFAYLEAKQDILARDLILQRGKLILLRACNQLVRRLSKANDLVFCGRILMLLACVFPIAEKSAVNIRGAFNTANKTTFQTTHPDQGSSEGETGPLLDFKFYCTFWSLQEFFCNPPMAVSKWADFCESLKAVVGTFSAQPLVDSAAASSVGGDLGSFNVKYLTSPNLLGLELKDHSFRRHVLLQCLFLLDYICSSQSQAGIKQQEKGREKEREERRLALLASAKQLQEEVRKLLGSIPPKGSEFVETVDRVLWREQNWVQWKRDGCPPFDRPPVKLTTAPQGLPGGANQRNPRGVGRAPVGGPRLQGSQKLPRRNLQQAQAPRLGNTALAELFDWADKHPDILTDPEAVTVPRLRDFLEPLAQDMDPASETEEELHRKNDRVFCWRALRLAAKQDIEAFNRFDSVNGIEMVVPPDMLTEEVREKLHKKPATGSVGAVRQRKGAAQVPQPGETVKDNAAKPRAVNNALPDAAEDSKKESSKKRTRQEDSDSVV